LAGLGAGFLDGDRYVSDAGSCASHNGLDLPLDTRVDFDFDFARAGGVEELAAGIGRANISGVVPVTEDEDWGGVCNCTIGGDMFLLDFDLDFDLDLARTGGREG